MQSFISKDTSLNHKPGKFKLLRHLSLCLRNKLANTNINLGIHFRILYTLLIILYIKLYSIMKLDL